MVSKAWIAFDENADDIRRLLEIHATLGGDARGRRYRLEVLNKSAIILITAIWEAFCEDIAAEALDFLLAQVSTASKLPLALRKRIANDVKADRNELAVWDLAGEGWKARTRSHLNERIRKLNTPKCQNVDELFEDAIGLAKLSDSWSWSRTPVETSRNKLDDYVSLRGALAHGDKDPRSVTKAEVEEYFEHVRRLAERSGGRINSFITAVTGTDYPPFFERIIAEGPCTCERASCVGANRRMYCYWRKGLSPWVIKKRLHWRCYDQKVTCPRCRSRHKRGHVGKLGVCDRPYSDQRRQTDGSRLVNPDPSGR